MHDISADTKITEEMYTYPTIEEAITSKQSSVFCWKPLFFDKRASKLFKIVDKEAYVLKSQPVDEICQHCHCLHCHPDQRLAEKREKGEGV